MTLPAPAPVRVDPGPEIRRLQGTVSALISLLAIPALWTGRDPPEIVAALLDVLIATLHLDFAAARLDASVDGAPVQVARLPYRHSGPPEPAELCHALAPWLVPDHDIGPFPVPNPCGNGTVRLARFLLGLHQDVGVLVAGSSRPDFPTDLERLLLRVASNQVAIELHEARRWREQERLGMELEQRVFERTAQLSAANRELEQRILEHRRAERRLAVQYAVTRTLAESDSLVHAAPALLAAVGDQLEWDWGALWLVDLESGRLRCVESWRTPGLDTAAFDQAGRDLAFTPGKGMLGRVWQSGVPEWLMDPATSPGFQRSSAAAGAGFCTALAFPIRLRGETLGVVEFFCRAAREPDREQLDSLIAIGSQIGQFCERKQNELALRRSEAYLAEAQVLSHTGCWAQRVPGGESYWSDEVFRIVGLDPRRTRPSRQLLAQLWHPADRAAAEATIEAAQCELRAYELELRVLRPDGSVRHVHLLGHPVLAPDGSVVEFMGVIMDVTERKQAERALRRARERGLEARFDAILDERTRLAREMHDTLLQGFTGVALQLVAVAGRVTDPPETLAALREVIALAQRTLADARRAVWGLRAPALAEQDLPATLRTAAEEAVRATELALTVEITGATRSLPPDAEAVVLRVAHEALVNVVKHAAARRVRVKLAFETRALTLAIADDGAGFEVDPGFRSYGGHWGLIGMRERASQVYGTLEVRSAPGRGTEIALAIPYARKRRPVATRPEGLPG